MIEKIKFLMQNILISTDDISEAGGEEEGKEILEILENLQEMKVIYFIIVILNFGRVLKNF